LPQHKRQDPAVPAFVIPSEVEESLDFQTAYDRYFESSCRSTNGKFRCGGNSRFQSAYRSEASLAVIVSPRSFFNLQRNLLSWLDRVGQSGDRKLLSLRKNGIASLPKQRRHARRRGDLL